MARAFYPFVEGTSDQGGELHADYPARIAVYDDAATAPRVVVVEAREPRAFLEEITATVVRLAKEQGGTIPFMVIREVVENFIHAYFIQPTISILDGGQTIRFSDQGPGIKEKERALEYGTSSATEEMKQYIRGVGSGLPYAQQYMADKGGSLTIEDNIAGGTIVTISAVGQQDGARPVDAAGVAPSSTATGAGASQDWGSAGQPLAGPWPQQGAQQPSGAWPQQSPLTYQPQPWPPQTPGTQAYPTGTYQQPVQQPMYPQPQPWAAYPATAPTWGAPQPYTPTPSGWPNAVGAPAQSAPSIMPTPASSIPLSPRGRQVIEFLLENGSVGPTDLARTLGSSAATWSRELSALEEAGLVRKPQGGQRRELTDAGRMVAQTLR